MNININDIKNGMSVIINDVLYHIISFQHVKPGKGPAFIRIKLKNIRTGSTIEETFNTNIKVKKAHIDKIETQFLYESGDNFVFMNLTTYEQIEVLKDTFGIRKNFVKEGLVITIEFFEGEIIGIDMPEKLEFEIIETEPAVKGNTTQNASKDAKIETNYTIKVPLFINTGDRVIISTKDGSYSSRA